MGIRNKILLLLLAAILSLSGCTMATLDDLYCLPKRSEEFENLQAVIDKAMQGLTYSAPMYGENRQALQTADLDGDGVDERILFAKDDSDKPLKILIFSELASGYVLMDTIEGYGFGFDFVTYAQMDDKPGLELIVGRQVSNQVMRSVAVYRFTSGFARQLMNTSYHQIATTDMDQDGIGELFLLMAGPADQSAATARLYRYHDGEMQRSEEVQLSASMSGFKQMKIGTLLGGKPAIYVTCSVDTQTLLTDVFALEEGKLSIFVKSIPSTAIDNYYVYPEDMDADGVPELPLVEQINSLGNSDHPQYLIRWYNIDSEKREHERLCTYHHFDQNWYLELDKDIIPKLAVQQTEDGVIFFHGGKRVLSVMALTDADREEQSQHPACLILYHSESVIFVAVIDDNSIRAEYADRLIARFHPIRMDLNTEED